MKTFRVQRIHATYSKSASIISEQCLYGWHFEGLQWVGQDDCPDEDRQIFILTMSRDTQPGPNPHAERKTPE